MAAFEDETGSPATGKELGRAGAEKTPKISESLPKRKRTQDVHSSGGL
jgi:hypothetical protein